MDALDVRLWVMVERWKFWVFPIQRSLSFLVLPICQNQHALLLCFFIFFLQAHLSSFLRLWALDIYTLGLTNFFPETDMTLYIQEPWPGWSFWQAFFPRFYWNMVDKNCAHLRCATQCVDTHIYCKICCFWNVCLKCDIRKRPDFRVR